MRTHKSRTEAEWGDASQRPLPLAAGESSRDVRVWIAVARKWWVILLCAILAGAISVAYASRHQTVRYRADAVVVASRSPIPDDDLSTVLQTVFATDPILDPAITQLGIEATPSELLSSGVVASDSQEGGALEITVRAQSPELAQELANAIAENFKSVAEADGLGRFAVLEETGAVATALISLPRAGLMGTLLGGLLGFSLLATTYFFNQPVLSESEALVLLGADASFSVWLRLLAGPALFDSSRRSLSRKVPEISPQEAVLAVLRAAAGEQGRSANICCILLEGSGRKRQRGGVRWSSGARTIAEQAVLEQMDARPFNPPTLTKPSQNAAVSWISSTDERLPEALNETEAVIILVPAGARRGSLEALAEELFVSGDNKLRVLLFMNIKRALL
jgi:capsular polysaccharide biosynthesis protein